MELSLRKFADLVGVSEKAIRKGIKSGRLQGFVGTTATGQPVIANVDGARAAWDSTRRVVAPPHDRPKPIPIPPPPQAEATGSSLPVADRPSGGDGYPPHGMPLTAKSLTDATILATLERARKLRLENDVAEGRLVSIEVVSKVQFESMRIVRESILNLPARLAGELAAQTDPARVQIMLETALREALIQTADAMEPEAA